LKREGENWKKINTEKRVREGKRIICLKKSHWGDNRERQKKKKLPSSTGVGGKKRSSKKGIALLRPDNVLNGDGGGGLLGGSKMRMERGGDFAPRIREKVRGTKSQFDVVLNLCKKQHGQKEAEGESGTRDGTLWKKRANYQFGKRTST